MVIEKLRKAVREAGKWLSPKAQEVLAQRILNEVKNHRYYAEYFSEAQLLEWLASEYRPPRRPVRRRRGKGWAGWPEDDADVF
jgi:hypothetical protein